MLYKFKSKVTGDVIMLQPNGKRLLEIIGKSTPNDAGDKGIILALEMTAALAALQAAITHEEAAQQAAIAQALADHAPPPRFEAVSLRQRALPLMDMLRRCAREDEAIVWGV
jgi:hypothetical protein